MATLTLRCDKALENPQRQHGQSTRPATPKAQRQAVSTHDEGADLDRSRETRALNHEIRKEHEGVP